MTTRQGKEREFMVHAHSSVGLTKRVRAKSAAEAVEKAKEFGVPGLCHQCESAGKGYDDSWTLNGMGDDVDDITAEETGR